MPSKKRQTIRANPLDEIEILSTLSTKEIAPRAPKKIDTQKIAASKMKPSNGSSAEEIFDMNDAEIILANDQDISEAKKITRHGSAYLTAEEIFSEELGAGRPLALTKPMNDIRRHRANKCIQLWSWASVPTALIPFVVVDVAMVIGIQVKMIKDLCQLYEVPFKNENARAFISALVGGGVATIASSGLKHLLLKSLPHFGSTIAFLAQPALGFSTTYALGQVFVKHLENDGALDTFDAEKMRITFREQLEAGKEFFKKGRHKPSKDMG